MRNPELSPNSIGRNIAKRGNAFKTDVNNGIAEFKNRGHNIQRKIITSGVLAIGELGVNWGVGIPMASAKSGLIPDDLNTAGMLGLAYGVNIAVGLVFLNQERRLLENKRIEMSPDFIATSIYHGLGKVSFLKERAKERSIAAVSVPTLFTIAATAGAFFSIAALSPEMMRDLILLNSGQAGFNLIQSGIIEIVLRTAGRKKEQVIVDLSKKS